MSDLTEIEMNVLKLCNSYGVDLDLSGPRVSRTVQRASLNWLELNKQVVKVVRPTGETRHAYYSLPNGERQ